MGLNESALFIKSDFPLELKDLKNNEFQAYSGSIAFSDNVNGWINIVSSSTFTHEHATYLSNKVNNAVLLVPAITRVRQAKQEQLKYSV